MKFVICHVRRCLQHSQVLSNLFAVKSELSDSKFELKVNDVRFVGHPLRLNPAAAYIPTQTKRKLSTIILSNIVFALKVCTSLCPPKCFVCYHLSLVHGRICLCMSI